jgi:hypothetical protein
MLCVISLYFEHLALKDPPENYLKNDNNSIDDDWKTLLENVTFWQIGTFIYLNV